MKLLLNSKTKAINAAKKDHLDFNLPTNAEGLEVVQAPNDLKFEHECGCTAYLYIDGKLVLNPVTTKNDWKRGRAGPDGYPSIEDQLDTIYHDGLDAWKLKIAAIKAKYPKPE